MTAQMSIVARRRAGTSVSAAMASSFKTSIGISTCERPITRRIHRVGPDAQRILGTISGVMGLVALLLASMGIYGVTAYTVVSGAGSSPSVSRSGLHARASSGRCSGKARTSWLSA